MHEQQNFLSAIIFIREVNLVKLNNTAIFKFFRVDR